MTEPLLVGFREAARRLGIGRDATYTAVREGRIRSLSVGRRVLIPVRELDDFVAREVNRDAAGSSA